MNSGISTHIQFLVFGLPHNLCLCQGLQYLMNLSNIYGLEASKKQENYHLKTTFPLLMSQIQEQVLHSHYCLKESKVASYYTFSL